jgi:hypothetical protein
MIRISLTFTRPSEDIPWHFEDESGILTEEVKRIIYKEFIMPVKMLYSDRILSEDKLQVTMIGYWDTHESIIEYQNHPKLVEINLKRNSYYKKNNCTIGKILKTETDKISPDDLV